MKELLAYIISNLVSKKDQVKITDTENNGVVTLTVTVANDDIGRIIGKAGKTIRAIRTIVRLSQPANKKAYIEIKPQE